MIDRRLRLASGLLLGVAAGQGRRAEVAWPDPQLSNAGHRGRALRHQQKMVSGNRNLRFGNGSKLFLVFSSWPSELNLIWQPSTKICSTKLLEGLMYVMRGIGTAALVINLPVTVLSWFQMNNDIVLVYK